MAISLVILLWLLSGAAEFSIALFQYIQLRDAAQEGALYGSLYPTDATGIANRIRGASDTPLDLQDEGAVTVEVFIDDDLTDDADPADTVDDIPSTSANYTASACEGHGLKIIVSYDHHIFMPFMAQILRTDTIPLVAEVTDTILTPQCP